METNQAITENMEVDEPEPGSSSAASKDQVASTSTQSSSSKLLLANASSVASVAVSLHPLILMNISDHWTRIRAQEGAAKPVYGALIGKQKGRKIEVLNSFEIKYEIIDNDVIINKDYYTNMEAQYKQVFSELDFIGWYTADSGSVPIDQHIKIHRQVCQINESPIFLQLDCTSKKMDTLPISLYESVIDIVQGEATMLFVPINYTLATEEAERIGVDHVARMASSNDAGENSFVAEHLMAQNVAIKMLHSRVKLVLQYVKAVEEGVLKPNNEILREAYTLSHRLPVIQNPTFRQEFYTQSNDVGLITYLGALTKGCNDMNQLVNKFNVLYDRQIGRRMRGLFF